MKKELLTYKDPKSPISEIFRTLRTNIQFMNSDRKLKTLLVTSTFPGEGKSWVTSNLAVTFAQAGKRVVLVDADMRKGRQYNIFGVLPKPGLSNYLSNMDADNMETNDLNAENYIQETDIENLYIIPAGNVPPNPSELLVSHRMKGLLFELKSLFDIVIIDGTPCDLVTDSVILSRVVDSTIIVTAQKETKKENLTRIVKNIQNVGGKIAGVVVNKVDISAKKYNQTYYYGSTSTGSKKRNSSKNRNKKIDEFFSNMKNNNDFDYDSKEDEEDYYSKDKVDDINYNLNKDNYSVKNEDYTKEVSSEVIIDSDEDTKTIEIFEDTDSNKSKSKNKNNYNENKKIINKDKSEINENGKENITNEDSNATPHHEVEVKIDEKGTIKQIENEASFDKKTQDIIRKINEYIEAEKHKQGEKD